jgi:type II secretory pathway component PulK
MKVCLDSAIRFMHRGKAHLEMKVGAKRDRRGSRLRKASPGFVLVAVLVVVMLASMVALSLLFHLRAAETSAAAGSGSEQAWAAALSGVDEAMRVATQTTSGSFDWQDNPGAFRERLILEDGSERWYFTVYTMSDPDRPELRFGLTDEASKLNLASATEAMLEKLPQMTPYLVQGLLDFLDADNTPRLEGAEQEYYDNLTRPYTARNGPLATLDEILLVRGFTPALLYGEDANLNFQLDPNEDDGGQQPPTDNKDGRLDGGLRQYLTVSSYDLNQDSSRAPRIDLNNPTDALPENDLPPALLNYINALRRNKVRVAQPADLLEANGKFKDEKGQEVELESGVGKTELATLLDRFTTSTNSRLSGLLNINTASAKVLQTLPDITEALAESIVATRRNLRPEQRRTAAWLYEEGLVNAELFKKIAPHFTARGLQFRFQVVGYGVPSGRFRVLEAVIDVAGSQPAIIYLRDLTRLGLPFKIDASPETAESVYSSPSAGFPNPTMNLKLVAAEVTRRASRSIPNPPPYLGGYGSSSQGVLKLESVHSSILNRWLPGRPFANVAQPRI